MILLKIKKSYLIRAKTDWIEESEKNTAYFANLEKSILSRKILRK